MASITLCRSKAVCFWSSVRCLGFEGLWDVLTKSYHVLAEGILNENGS